jgi:type IV secretion system protein TrbJ
MKRIFFTVAVTIASTAIAGGDGGNATSNCVGCATEATQLLNNAQLAQQAAQQAQMIQQQLQQLQQAIAQTSLLQTNTQAAPSQLWGNASTLLQQLQNVVQQGNAISYASANIDSRFRQTYSGYQPTPNYSQSYQNWSSATLDSIRTALNAANLQSQNFATEEGLVKQLQTLGKSNTGQMQAIQTGNMISIELVQQLRQLRQLNMAQMQAQNNYLAASQTTAATNQANQDRLFNNIPEPGLTTQYQYFQGGSK